MKPQAMMKKGQTDISELLRKGHLVGQSPEEGVRRSEIEGGGG